MKHLTSLFILMWWIHGIAVVKGFWLTLLAFVFPPAAWYFSMVWFTERFL